MKLSSIAAVLLLAGLTLALSRNCKNITVPVKISSRNDIFNVSLPTTDIDVANFMLDYSQLGHDLREELRTGYQNVSGTYHLAATYCEPLKGLGHNSTIQIMTPGIGFDRSYWDFPYGNYNYSYVNQALSLSHATLNYDRLGSGQSSRGNPISTIQAPLEVAALHALTTMARVGSLPGISTAFEPVIHVGHSFGSLQTFMLTLAYPADSNAIILTGFSTNGSFVADFAAGGNFVSAPTVPALDHSYADGYFAAADASAVQYNFFAPGDFDPAVLQLAYTTGQPVAVGELLTLLTAPATNSFAGPVLVITGERDVPYCGGDCYATGGGGGSIPAGVREYFPKASKFEAYVVPGAGHGLNLQYSHAVTYDTILGFLGSVGFGRKD